MGHTPPKRSIWLAVICTALSVGCSDRTESVAPHRVHVASASANAATLAPGTLKGLHAATSRYHSMEQARRAGYQDDPFCVEVPGLGGMGHHWVNGGLVDPVFNLTEPEVLLYAPDASGERKLVAVEYIVIDVGQPRPSFDGHPFDIGGTPVPAPHWSLHVWIHQDNPNGVFTPFNPTVSCTP